MSGWKAAWETLAVELRLYIEKSDLFGRPTSMVGTVEGRQVRISHFAEHGDEKARIMVAFDAGGPPAGLTLKRRTSGHWKLALALHPRHRRVGLWELWANNEREVDLWLTEERQHVITHLDSTAELTRSELASVMFPATDKEMLLRTVRGLATEANILAADPSAAGPGHN